MARWFKKKSDEEAGSPQEGALPKSIWDDTDVPWDDTNADPAETNLAPTPPPPTRRRTAEPLPPAPAPPPTQRPPVSTPEPPAPSVSQPVAIPGPADPIPVPPPAPAVSQPIAVDPRDADTSDRTIIGVDPNEVVGILLVREGMARGEIYKVFNGENVLGRGKTARIHLDERDVTVSREHARITHDQGRFAIQALREEQNPTYLNEVKVVGGAELRDGDMIRVGHTVLKFRIG